MAPTIILCGLSHTGWLTIAAGVGFFLAATVLLVVILLVAKHYLVQSGDVTITVNGDRSITTPSGTNLLSTMADA